MRCFVLFYTKSLKLGTSLPCMAYIELATFQVSTPTVASVPVLTLTLGCDQFSSVGVSHWLHFGTQGPDLMESQALLVYF